MATDENTDFDEDIILPNSPLGQYVKELNNKEGDDSFLECPTKTNETVETEKKKECVGKSNKFSFSPKALFLKELKYWKDLLSSSFLQSNLEVGNAHLNTFLDTTMKNCLLTPDDRSFINNLSSETLVLGKVPPLLTSKLFFYSVLSFITFCIIACIGTILNNSYIILLPTVLFLLFGVSIFSFFLYCQYTGTEYQLSCLSLLSFPSSTKIALMLIKDCGIRLIQEAELIARGFTSASVVGAAEHIELSFALPIGSPSRQYSELRKCIFNWLRITFMNYRTLTLDMMQKIPVETAFTPSNCLATLNINEFGGFLNHEMDSSEILEVTDNFSIQSLKTMHRIAEMQASEFFKHIATRLYLQKDQEPMDCWKMIKDIRWLVSCTQPLDKKMTLMFHEVYKTYKYYKSIEASYVDDKKAPSSVEPKSPKSDLKVTLHNMSLHLKAALLRLIEIEDQFNNKTELDHFVSRANLDQYDTNSNLDIKTELDDFKKHVPSLLPLLNVAKTEVNAFDECYNKFSKILDHLLYPEKENSAGDISPVKMVTESADKAPTSIERCDAEREIQDEVFEGTATETCNGDQKEGAAFIGEEARKNAEVASFLLKELKNVLINKADEHRVREQIALAKKKGNVNSADNDDCVDSDPDDIIIDDNTKEKNDNVKGDQKNVQCENEASLVEDSDLPKFLNISSDTMDSFAASIATLAAQRQKMLGLSSEEFIDGSGSDSD